MTSENELKDAAYRVNRCEAGETLLVVYDAESWPLAKIAYRDDCERLAIAYLARLAADEQLRKDWNWVCRKIGVPEDSNLLSGDQTVAGQLHVLCSHAHGYKTYIEAFRCDDKQGEIARLTVERNEAREEYVRLYDRFDLVI